MSKEFFPQNDQATQDIIIEMITSVAPDARASRQVKNGEIFESGLDLEKLAAQSRKGVEFEDLLKVLYSENAPKEEQFKFVKPELIATIFNTLLGETAQPEGMGVNYIRTYFERVVEKYDNETRDSSLVDKPIHYKIAESLLERDRDNPISAMEATSRFGDLSKLYIWGFVRDMFVAVHRAANELRQPIPLLFPSIANKIESQKAISQIHDPDSTKLLMNIQTILYGSQDFQRKI